MFPKKKIISIL